MLRSAANPGLSPAPQAAAAKVSPLAALDAPPADGRWTLANGQPSTNVHPPSTLSPLWQPGDLIACYGHDALSRVVSWRTSWLVRPRGLRWGPSHVAIAAPYQDGLACVESTMLCRHPCLVRGDVVRGWQVHGLAQRVEDYRQAGGCVEVYRLAPHCALRPHELDQLAYAAIDVWRDRATDYDLITALLSGSRLLRLTRLFPAADGRRLFCSEFCGLVLQSLGRLCPDENASRHNPASLLARLVRAGTYRRVLRYRGNNPPRIYP